MGGGYSAEDLDKRANELDKRTEELDKRAKELDKRKEQLDKREKELMRDGGRDPVQQNSAESETPNSKNHDCCCWFKQTAAQIEGEPCPCTFTGSIDFTQCCSC